MSICYYVCPMVEVTEPGPVNRAPKVYLYNVSYASVGNFSIKSWCIVCVEAEDHSEIQADSQIKLIAEDILDTTYGSLNSTQQSKIVAALTYAGISYVPQDENTVEDLLVLLVEEFSPNGSVPRISTSA